MLRAFARQLLTCEANAGSSAAAPRVATFRVLEKLSQHLSKLMGAGGVHALCARALALARPEVPWLAQVQVKPDGSLEGLAQIEPQPKPDEMVSGEVVLVAQLLGLLVMFIGPSLTLMLIREAWPEAVFNEVDFVE